MVDALTYGTELAVGLATLALGVLAWRRGTRALRFVGVMFGVAGVAAIVHAAAQLAG
jgi:hypothetical protein